jgi:putative transcriptional regulator
MSKQTAGLEGQVLVALPNTAHHDYRRAILLVTSHWQAGSSMIMLNKPSVNQVPVTTVLERSGIACLDWKGTVYYGGPDEPNKVQFLHTLDWAVANTQRINNHLGITSETSILAAIAANEGPRAWRCYIGQRILGPGELEGELLGEYPWIPGHRWLQVPADIMTVFAGEQDHQWISAVETAGRQEVSSWF